MSKWMGRPSGRSGDGSPAPQDVHTITSVQQALSEEQDARARRYIISMAIRTACVILTIVVPSPWRWFFAVGAVFLPYIAVVMVNQRRRIPGLDAPKPTRRQLLPGPPSPDDQEHQEPETSR